MVSSKTHTAIDHYCNILPIKTYYKNLAFQLSEKIHQGILIIIEGMWLMIEATKSIRHSIIRCITHSVKSWNLRIHMKRSIEKIWSYERFFLNGQQIYAYVPFVRAVNIGIARTFFLMTAGGRRQFIELNLATTHKMTMHLRGTAATLLEGG